MPINKFQLLDITITQNISQKAKTVIEFRALIF